MITQQAIVDEINRLTLQYNITWLDILIDADKAITKINNFIGTKYPSMSSVLDAPTRTYAFRSGVEEDGPVDTPYFPDEHIYGVVIPFIAMEVLARDEEFTTVYNKYANDLEDGLFQMFQKEFNRVPLAFRQNPDAGVFFAADSALSEVARNGEADLPVYKFKVHYHINQEDIALGDIRFVEDTRAYLYEDTTVVKGWNTELISADGIKVYSFTGWSRDPNSVADAECAVGTEITLLTDVHYYAHWDVESTLTNTVYGVVTIKNEYKYSLTQLIIPSVVSNNMVRTIPTDFLLSTNAEYEHATRLLSITLPDYLTGIAAGAFNGFQGDEIIFPDTIVDNVTYEGITIEVNAFIASPNLLGITLPANVRTIETGAFPAINDITRTIRCRILEQNEPVYNEGPPQYGWQANWYSASNELVNYVVNVTWGYNG